MFELDIGIACVRSWRGTACALIQIHTKANAWSRSRVYPWSLWFVLFIINVHAQFRRYIVDFVQVTHATLALEPVDAFNVDGRFCIKIECSLDFLKSNQCFHFPWFADIWISASQWYGSSHMCLPNIQYNHNQTVSIQICDTFYYHKTMISNFYH